MEEQTDILAIEELVALERHWRDGGQWDQMRSAYHPNSVVRVVWFQGSGFAFLEASKDLHRLSPPLVCLHGERALVETDTLIETRTLLDGIEVDTTAHGRLFSRVQRDEGIWRFASLDFIDEKDWLVPVNPSDQVLIGPEELRQYRPSYRFLCSPLRHLGRAIDADLPGDDRPELVAALYAEAENWLLQQR